MKTTIVSPFIAALRLGLSTALVIWSITSCAPPTPLPPSGGPAFVINSPAAGSSVAGPTYFSVQPFDASSVASARFKAGSKDLGSDTTAADGLKVFLIPKDFPAGTLNLEATLTGKDGKTSTQTISMTNVPNPPSSATVGTSGAVLGTAEVSGALSTLTLPPGAASGANLSFSAKTKEQVKASTGVDYDALGVTFLGAQEIASSQSISSPLGVSSGGFGPMVQPKQVVVNYMIAPDADGDGKGELMVINTASVAPNGDVISDPVPQVQLGTAKVKTASRTQSVRSLQTATLSGPPGTFIEVEARGFNQFSALGNVARFKSGVSGAEIEIPAIVNNHYDQPGAMPTVGFYIPAFPAGAATVTLTNLGSGMSAPPISLSVQTPPALSKAPAAIIDEHFAKAIEVLSKLPELKAALSSLESVRSSFATLSDTPTPEEAKLLNDVAVFISNSNAAALLKQIESGIASNPSALSCSALQLALGAGMTAYGAYAFAAGLLVAAVSPVGAIALIAAFGLAAVGGSLLGAGGVITLIAIYDCLTSPPPGTCLPPYTAEDLAALKPPGSQPEGIRRQATPPPPVITGMGSVVPPGGDSCGSAFGGSGASGSSLQGLRNQTISTQSFFGDLGGRFIVKVFYGAGNSVPFTGISDSSGYFYVPQIPANQPFEAIAFDTQTKQTRSFKGTGPAVGQSAYMFFDFLSESNSGSKVIGYDTNTQGVHDGTDIYLFEGKAGDLITLAVFSEEGGAGKKVGFKLSDPGGRQMLSGLHTGGFYLDIGIIKLEQDGLHSYTLDGSQASGNYTLGLSKIDPPIPLDLSKPLVGELGALGDRQFYSFSGTVNDVVKLTLSHNNSSLNAQLLLREPLSTVPFYQQPTRLRILTSDARRSATSSRTLTVAGEYLLEVTHDGSPFKNQLQKYVGSYQVDVVKTP